MERDHMPIALARLLAGTALCLSLFCLSSLGSLQAAASGADIIFPQVARGTQGSYIESAIVILNPQPDPVTIDLDSFGVDLPETTIVVKAGETKEIRFSGSEFQAGWVRLRSDRSVSATANILTREDATSENLLSQLTVLGQPLSSKFVVPVFFHASHIDDTGIALAIPTSGRLRLTLLDELGETVAVRNLSVSAGGSDPVVDITGHFAAFLSEIFSLPPEFTRGSLTIEQVLPEKLPVGFSAVAIYTSGAGWHTSPTLALDLPGTYSLALREAPDPDQVAKDLAMQYGVFIDGILVRPGVFAVTMSEEVARAVSRDPRVLLVERAENAGTRWRFEFQGGMEDWSVGFSDLPADFDPSGYELHFEHTNLPVYLGSEKAILMQGHNRSDDLFMFAKRRIDGLKPNTTYNIRFDVEIATAASRDAVGAGGAPGESVWLKAGASLTEPEVVIDAKGRLVINIDKGNQSPGGEQAVVLGNIAKRSSVFSKRFELKTLDNLAQPFSIKTDESGSVWLLIGTDSGFEGKTILYYNRISVIFYEQ